jgi:hypothetical protein
MAFLERKSPQQAQLEKKIQILRNAGMVASAERLQRQLDCLLHRNGVEEKVKPMSGKELVKKVKEQKALGQKA